MQVSIHDVEQVTVENGITYMQRTGKGAGYEVPANVSTVAGVLQLMLDRGDLCGPAVG